jgi:diguanylate cyclase (GGDEF)-like protein/PAS domain S-box-containing protein
MISEAQISAVFGTLCKVSEDGFIICRADGTILYANPATKAIFGIEPDELVGQALDVLIPDNRREKHHEHLKAFIAGDDVTKSMSEREAFFALTGEGDERPIRATLVKAEVDGEILIAALVRDALVDTLARQRLMELAETEPLTGLLNRRGFLRVAAEKIERARGRDQPMSVAILDLDHLKKINDTHGHQVGDAVIQRIARVIKKNIRGSDAAGRMGGDEFVILFDGADAEIAERACARIRDELGDSAIRIGDAIVDGITLSGGISGVVSTDRSIDAALARADSLMYSAKQMGRNTVHATG